MNDMKVTGKDLYSDNVRLCIIDLFGLEIAVSKVSRVMEVVCKHIFNVNLKQLPSRGCPITWENKLVEKFVADIYIKRYTKPSKKN